MVSIVVPNYNHAPYLRKRLDTIFNQTYQDFEVIILDDASTDKSKEIIDQYLGDKRIKQVIYNSQNSGSPFIQWEKGISFCSGKYIWIAESDDYSEATFLDQLVSVLENDENLTLAFSGSYWIDDLDHIGNDLSVHKSGFCRWGTDEIRNHLVRYCSIQNVSSVVFRSSSLKALPNVYTKYKYCGDWIIYVLLLAQGKLYFLDKKLNYFRWYHNNTSSSSGKSGLWLYEGVHVIRHSCKNVNFSSKEKQEVIEQWRLKLKPLRKTIPFSLRKLFSIHFELFRFSPINYIRAYNW